MKIFTFANNHYLLDTLLIMGIDSIRNAVVLFKIAHPLLKKEKECVNNT